MMVLMARRVSILLLSCLFIVVMPWTTHAAGIEDDTPQDQQSVFSYWNIDYIYATRADDYAVILFDFPNDFFYRESLSTETVTITGRTLDGTLTSSISLTFYGYEINGLRYMYIVLHNTSGFKHIEISWLNSVIHPSSSLNYSVYPDPQVSVPYFQIVDPDYGTDLTDEAVALFSSDWSVVLPSSLNGASDVSFTSSSGSSAQLQSTSLPGEDLSYYYMICPSSYLSDVQRSMGGLGYPSYALIPYFDRCKTAISLVDGYISTDIRLFLPVGVSDTNGYQAGGIRVSAWYDLFHSFASDVVLPSPVSPTMPADIAKGAVRFFGIVFSGIFAIEIFPSIFIGGIVFCIFGVGFVFAFLRWFNGG